MGMARVFLNAQASPGAAFAPHATNPMRTWGFKCADVVAADYDGNGRDDFAVLNKDSNTVTVFLTDTQPTLLPDARQNTTTPRCLADADLEKDVLSVDFRLYKLELRCGYHPIAMTAADFDFNGKLDLAVAHQSATEEVSPQSPSCIELLFDVSCGFHVSNRFNPDVPGQLEHWAVPGVLGAGEQQSCPTCEQPPCVGNTAPETEITTGN
jgi:hypothetical protein